MAGGGGGVWVGRLVGNLCPSAQINIALLITKLSFSFGESSWIDKGVNSKERGLWRG